MASGAIDRARTGRWINEWNLEDKGFWEESGKHVARRNLVFSIFTEFLGFSAWQLFSIVAALLPLIGYGFTAPQLFSLVALPLLAGASMRFPYAFAVVLIWGRNWTIIGALLLLAPTIMLGVIIQNPETPYWLFAVAAALGGFGGGTSPPAWRTSATSFPTSGR